MADFKKVTTGNGFQNELIATTNDRLEMTVTALESLNQSLMSNLIFLQGDVEDLIKTTKKSNEENIKLQKRFLFLAVVSTALACLQIILVADVIRGWIERLLH